MARGIWLCQFSHWYVNWFSGQWQRKEKKWFDKSLNTQKCLSDEKRFLPQAGGMSSLRPVQIELMEPILRNWIYDTTTHGAQWTLLGCKRHFVGSLLSLPVPFLDLADNIMIQKRKKNVWLLSSYFFCVPLIRHCLLALILSSIIKQKWICTQPLTFNVFQ